MTRLRDHPGIEMYEESVQYLLYALEDYRWARRFVRRLGMEERERFCEGGWAYGDPTLFYGDDAMEVFAYQARVVARTLFGEGVSCDLSGYNSEDEELYHLRAALVDECGESAFGTPVGKLEEQYTVHGEALYGDSFTLACGIRGDAGTLWRIRGALRHVAPEIPILHYTPGAEHGDATDPSEHFVLLYEGEFYPEREVIHHKLFDTLLAAWEGMKGPDTSEDDALDGLVGDEQEVISR